MHSLYLEKVNGCCLNLIHIIFRAIVFVIQNLYMLGLVCLVVVCIFKKNRGTSKQDMRAQRDIVLYTDMFLYTKDLYKTDFISSEHSLLSFSLKKKNNGLWMGNIILCSPDTVGL